MSKNNNKFPNFLFCLLFFFPFSIWANATKKSVMDSLVYEYGNITLLFINDDYEIIKKENITHINEIANPIDWDYVFNVKQIIENQLRDNGLPPELTAGIFHDIIHFRKNEMLRNMPSLGESKKKNYIINTKKDNKETNNEKSKEIPIEKNLEYHLKLNSKRQALSKNPFLVLENFMPLLKKQKENFGEDFALLSLFFYEKKEILENYEKFYKEQFSNEKTRKKKFKCYQQFQEPFTAFVVWQLINERLKNFEPNFILEKYICKKGDTWQNILHSKKVDEEMLYKYNNFFINEEKNIIKVQNVRLKAGDVLLLPIPNTRKKISPKTEIPAFLSKIDTQINDTLTNVIENTNKVTAQKDDPSKEEEYETYNPEHQQLNKEYKTEEKYQEEEKYSVLETTPQTYPNETKTRIYSASKYLDIGLLKAKSLQEENNKKNTQYHIVTKGETLWQIHQKYKINLQDLKNWNGIGTNSLIFVGQKLIINKNEKLRGKNLSSTISSLKDIRNIFPKIFGKNNKKILKLITFKNKILQHTSNKHIKKYKFYVAKTKNASTKRPIKKKN